MIPASAHWVCSAGAGSGRTLLLSQPPDPNKSVGFRRDRREAVFLLALIDQKEMLG